jgi:hypothetical protein
MLALMPSQQPTGPRAQDFQKISELVNKFVINTVHLMNTFASTCETRLNAAARTMQRIECQTTLLEYKLDSIDRDPATVTTGDADAKGKIGSGPSSGPGSVPAITAGPSGGAGRNNGKAGANLPLPKGRKTAPPMPDKGGRNELPVPGSKGPPAPPGAPPVPPPPPPIAPGAPPLIGTPPPPPPMPTSAGLTVRTHPRLAGYFKMAQAGVAVVAVKAKMKADGHNPDWFDNPNMPSPLPPIKKGAKPSVDGDSD